MSLTVDVDARGRVALGKVNAQEGTTYRATSFENGSILLEPVIQLTQAEIAVLRTPHVADALEDAFNGKGEDVAYGWRRGA